MGMYLKDNLTDSGGEELQLVQVSVEEIYRDQSVAVIRFECGDNDTTYVPIHKLFMTDHQEVLTESWPKGTRVSLRGQTGIVVGYKFGSNPKLQVRLETTGEVVTVPHTDVTRLTPLELLERRRLLDRF